MVQIHIKLPDNNENGPTELAIIELQGDLEVEGGEGLTNKFMGDIHFSHDGTPILIVGYHLMFGKVASLEKPMILLKKIQKTIERVRNDEDMEQGEDETAEIKQKTEYVVEAIIKKKILFNKRPRPIVSLETKIKF